MRHVADACRCVERRPRHAMAVRARVVDVERLVIGRGRVPEVVPGDVEGVVRHVDRREDLMPRARIVVDLDGGAEARAAVRRSLCVDVVVPGQALVGDVDEVRIRRVGDDEAEGRRAERDPRRLRRVDRVHGHRIRPVRPAVGRLDEVDGVEALLAERFEDDVDRPVRGDCNVGTLVVGRSLLTAARNRPRRRPSRTPVGRAAEDDGRTAEGAVEVGVRHVDVARTGA